MNTIGLVCFTSSHTFLISGPSTQLGMLWAPPPTLCMGLCSPLLRHLCRKAFPNMSKWGLSPASPLFSIASLYFFHSTCQNFQLLPVFGYLLISHFSHPQDLNLYKDLDHIFIVYQWIPSTWNIALTQGSSIKLLFILFILLMDFQYILSIGINIYQLKITIFLRKKMLLFKLLIASEWMSFANSLT